MSFANIKRFWWIWLCIISDIVVVVLHLWELNNPNTFFNLDYEQNFPTMYQTVKMVIISGFVFFHLYVQFHTKSLTNRFQFLAWFMLGMMFLWLGIDEIGQIHESIGGHFKTFFPAENAEIVEYLNENNYKSSSWLIYYSPFLLGGILFFVTSIRYFLRTIPRTAVALYVLGFLFFILVPVMEFISTAPAYYKTSYYNTFVIVEEYSEMLGATLCFIAMALVVRPSHLKLVEMFRSV
jgi:hypothetical protein